MSESSSNEPSPEREQTIRELAYQLWEAEGHPDGQADRHWFMAIEMLETGVVGMLPTVPVDNPHWLKRRKDERVSDAVMPQPVIPLSGRPSDDTHRAKDEEAA